MSVSDRAVCHFTWFLDVSLSHSNVNRQPLRHLFFGWEHPEEISACMRFGQSWSPFRTIAVRDP